jgi:hypothetical protein
MLTVSTTGDWLLSKSSNSAYCEGVFLTDNIDLMQTALERDA